MKVSRADGGWPEGVTNGRGCQGWDCKSDCEGSGDWRDHSLADYSALTCHGLKEYTKIIIRNQRHSHCILSKLLDPACYTWTCESGTVCLGHDCGFV